MAMAKRIFLFVVVNLLVVVTISAVVGLLGVRPYMNAYGLDYSQLAVFCMIWGFSGALISLAMSRVMAKWMMGVQLVDPNTQSGDAAWLYDTVKNLSRSAGLPNTPEVGIYGSPEVNAFATGPTKSRALVAVSEGLLRGMSKPQIEGVLAHEIAHVANGDMVTMTLVQGVVNSFVMFFARILAWGLSQGVDEEKRGWVNYLAVIIFEIFFSLLGMMVVAYYSRRREYRADHGGARLAGSDKMIGALEALRRRTEMIDDTHQAVSSLKISGKTGGLLALLSTHPPLEERIARLELGR